MHCQGQPGAERHQKTVCCYYRLKKPESGYRRFRFILSGCNCNTNQPFYCCMQTKGSRTVCDKNNGLFFTHSRFQNVTFKQAVLLWLVEARRLSQTIVYCRVHLRLILDDLKTDSRRTLIQREGRTCNVSSFSHGISRFRIIFMIT